MRDPGERHNKWVSGFYVRSDMALTKREREVLRLIADGATSEVIGVRLGLSKRTVDIYRTRLITKFMAKSSAHVVALAYERGILGRTVLWDYSGSLGATQNRVSVNVVVNVSFIM